MLEYLSGQLIYFTYYFSVQLEQILPYWVLGTVFGSVISVFGKEKIHTLFSVLQTKRLGIFGLIPASLVGIASPLCMYGTIPIAAAFSENGARDDWLAAFMMSSILLNPQLLFYSMALGETMVMVRLFSCILCGVTAGLCIRYLYRNRSFFNFSGFAEPSCRDIDSSPAKRLLLNIYRNFRATGGYFLLGIVIAVLFQMYVPQEGFAALFGDQHGFGVLMAATLGVPLYVCGGGTIPLLMEWLRMGMSPGAAAAFMITGPATKITNLGAMKIVLGAKPFLFYLGYVMVFAMLTGFVVDILL